MSRGPNETTTSMRLSGQSARLDCGPSLMLPSKPPSAFAFADPVLLLVVVHLTGSLPRDEFFNRQRYGPRAMRS